MKFPLVPAYYFSDIYAIDLARLPGPGGEAPAGRPGQHLVPYGVAEQPPGPGLEGRPGSGGGSPCSSSPTAADG